MKGKDVHQIVVKRKDIFGIIVGIHLLIWILNLPFSQLQMLLLGRRAITLYQLGMLECLLLGLLFMRSYHHIRLSRLSICTLGFVFLLIFFGLFSRLINRGISISDVMYYFISWSVSFVILIAADQMEFKIEYLMKVLMTIIIIHAVMIVIQRATASIIWPFSYDESGKQFFYISENYYNTQEKMVRCPGICASGLDAGLLLIFGCAMLKVIEFKEKIWRTVLVILFAAALWFTGTRNIYLTLIYILIYSFICTHTAGRWKVVLCNSFMIISTVFYTGLLNKIGHSYLRLTKNIWTDTFSALIRITNWENVWEVITSGNVFQILFGQLKWQANISFTNIDNVYLEVLLATGVVGLIAFCLYFLYLNNYLLRNSDNRISLLVAFVSAIFIYGVANVYENFYMALIIVAVLICEDARKNRQSKKEN